MRAFGAEDSFYDLSSERSRLAAFENGIGREAIEVVLACSRDEGSDLEQYLHSLQTTGTDIKPLVLDFRPQTLKEVVDMGLRIGHTTGHFEAAMRWIGAAEHRLQVIRSLLKLQRDADTSKYDRVVVLDRLDPLCVAGYWVSEIVEMAGGQPLLSIQGKPGYEVTWKEVMAADPSVILVALRGGPPDESMLQSVRETFSELNRSRAAPGKSPDLYVCDGRKYFNLPGPGVYRSIELAAAILYPAEMPSNDLHEARSRFLRITPA